MASYPGSSQLVPSLLRFLSIFSELTVSITWVYISALPLTTYITVPKSLTHSASVSLPVRLQAPPSFGESTYTPLSLLGCTRLLAQAPTQNLQADCV